MDLRNYEELPDVLPVEEIALMFKEVLEMYSQNSIEKIEFLNILSELTDRQVMTYEILNEDLKLKVDKELCNIWNTDSYKEVDIILSIVVNLGLERCFQKIKLSLNNNENISKEIKSEIEDTIEEVGDDISNPYSNL
ncbi:hypothetical protein PJ311_14945 [Bacillus sp. CLL-7-23]|uniref:Immunity protein Imm3 n=1 Tax=Bacillus changyiensis TaxID=3004103 RepID=A0ABT4X6F1_9BACI|nr:hypothetical protein [Bacillus changyiensis]MDA7027872.1 hypothetical protein [Bacillus changyiensis]